MNGFSDVTQILLEVHAETVSAVCIYSGHDTKREETVFPFPGSKRT